MARDFAKSFYNSKAWRQTRITFLQSKFGICERCGQPNAKQVHHKEYLSESNINDPNIALNFDNLELLCDTCHQNEHNEKSGVTISGLSFNAQGELIQAPQSKKYFH